MALRQYARVFLANLSSIEHLGVRAILIAELFTGARTGELRALPWTDLNLHLSDVVGEYGLVDISYPQPPTHSFAEARAKATQAVSLAITAGKCY